MITEDKLESHFEVVKAKHDALDKMIVEAYNHYIDDNEVHKMKREKLHLREEMDRIKSKLKEAHYG